MTITFPRAIPDALQVVGLSFYLQPMEELTALRSGKTISANIGPTLWRARYESRNLDEEELGVLRAWRDTLLSYEAFYGYDILREYPLVYRRTGWTGLTVLGSPFTGSCYLNAIADNNVQVGLSGLPVGFVFSLGDYIAFDYGTDSRALHRIVAAGVADGNGQVLLEVRPPVRVGWEAGSPGEVVDLYRPSAQMKMTPDSWQEPVDLNRTGKVTFEAVQTL